jgi:putative ABC transport system substrate-binding protein
MDAIRRRILFGTAAAPLMARGQGVASGTKKRLGAVYLFSQKVIDSFPYDPKPLASFGWVLGRNLEKVRRFADDDPSRFEALGRELVAERVDVIFTAGILATRAMQNVTRTIPICTIVDDPVGNGFARTLARPGGNITGLCEGYAESAQKEMELLRTAMPGVTHLAIVSTGRDKNTLRSSSQWLVKAATSAGLSVDVHAPDSRAEVEAIIDGLPAGKGALYIRWVHPKEVAVMARAAARRRIALVGQDERLVDHGMLWSYSPVIADDYELAAMLARLLSGANPAVTPFELPTKAVFVINRKAAAATGLKLPAGFVVMANRIVD